MHMEVYILLCFSQMSYRYTDVGLHVVDFVVIDVFVYWIKDAVYGNFFVLIVLTTPASVKSEQAFKTYPHFNL
jgi:Na+/H+ antiporter NhaA